MGSLMEQIFEIHVNSNISNKQEAFGVSNDVITQEVSPWL